MTYSPDVWLSYLRMADSELLRKCHVDIFKATGRGGQKKNKTSNAVRLSLGVLSTTESRSRSKAENISGALKKLRFAIAIDLLPDGNTESPLLPPKELYPYLNQTELRINPKNAIFPVFMGFLLRYFQAHQGDWSKLAEVLGTSKSQVRKFIDRNSNLKRAFSELQTKTRRRAED